MIRKQETPAGTRYVVQFRHGDRIKRVIVQRRSTAEKVDALIRAGGADEAMSILRSSGGAR